MTTKIKISELPTDASPNLLKSKFNEALARENALAGDSHIEVTIPAQSAFRSHFDEIGFDYKYSLLTGKTGLAGNVSKDTGQRQQASNFYALVMMPRSKNLFGSKI